MGVVMLADNDLDFLKTRAELLRNAGYNVITAGSLEEAERMFRECCVHVGVLDVRLVNDDDPHDVSGLTLAKRAEFRTIPKILLTGFPSYETVREGMSWGADGVPPVVDYLPKKEGADALVQAVCKSFSRHVRIDEELVVRFGERDPVSFSHLASWLDPSLSGDRLSHHTAGLRDLFCRLFYGKTEIRIERSLWKEGAGAAEAGRAALVVYSYTPGRPGQAQIVVCGQCAPVVAEAARYREFAPEAPGASGTVLVRTVEAQHFAANAYALAGTKIDNVHTLSEFYHELPERAFKGLLEHLFERTLAPWHSERSVAGEGRSLESLYREHLGLGDGAAAAAEMRKRVGAVARELLRLDVKLEGGASNLTIRIGNGTFSYPHPAACLCADFAADRTQLLANTPGDLTGRNVLADPEGRTWLTEFAHAGPKPLLWDYTALENVIRFDCVESEDISELHQMERALADSAFTSIHDEDVEPRLRKPLRAIREVRRLADLADGASWREYRLGLYFHAARRLMSFHAAERLTDKELAKAAHVVVAQAMIFESLKPKQPCPPPPAGIHVDNVNHTVTIDGRLVHLPPQSYTMLVQLHERKGQLCTRKEIYERVFYPEIYDAGNESHVRKLNTSVARLRRKIGDNPDKPRHLVKVQGVGYKLVY
jgi:DNA-binding response OmpR family regulator